VGRIYRKITIEDGNIIMEHGWNVGVNTGVEEVGYMILGRRDCSMRNMGAVWGGLL
jgi:hypothetical protein